MELRQITPEELKEVIRKHQLWLNGEEGGERADLRNANLSWANLSWARGKVLAIGPIGSRCGITYAYWAKDVIRIRCGCFHGSISE